jgi:transcriptional regulator with XRE-family HTH domain
MGKLTLAAARVANGLTQQEMAEKLGVSKVLINQLENGKTECKAVYLYAYCYVTGFKEDDFLRPEDLQKVNQ